MQLTADLTKSHPRSTIRLPWFFFYSISYEFLFSTSRQNIPLNIPNPTEEQVFSASLFVNKEEVGWLAPKLL
jgi:hypothetical protein